MIPLIIAAVGLTAAAAGSAVNAVKLSKQRKTLNTQMSELNSWYKSTRDEDLADNSQMRALLGGFQKNLKTKNKEASQNIVRSGMTTENAVAKAAQNNVMWGENIAKIAQKDSEHKQEIAQTYQKNATDIYNKIHTVQTKSMNNVSGITNDLFTFFTKG